jgi:hypothetical protein
MKFNISYVLKDSLRNTSNRVRYMMMAMLAALPVIVLGLGVASPAYASGDYGPRPFQSGGKLPA